MEESQHKASEFLSRIIAKGKIPQNNAFIVADSDQGCRRTHEQYPSVDAVC